MRSPCFLLLMLALSSAGGAAFLVQGLARTPLSPALPAKPDMVDILVASRAVAVGETVGREQVRWQSWPREAVPAGSLRRATNAPGASLPFEPAPARFALLEGEPVAASKLVRAENGSALALLLAPSMRAVSVPIREETSAGGLIQANDRVDVIVTRKHTDAGQDARRSEILLRDIRVLAAGKALNGKASALKTATLELTPSQARTLVAAQSGGDISLSLIGAGHQTAGDGATAAAGDPLTEIRVMKYGRSANRQAMQ
jgi:pilus assembly protein CpaB